MAQLNKQLNLSEGQGIKKYTYRHSLGRRLWINMKMYYGTYIMALPVILFFVIFAYFPMYGVIIAFQNYSPIRGIFGSEFIGFQHFTDFFSSFFFVRLLRNTLLISLYSLIFAFPAAIILALLLNEVKNALFKRTVQTITYMPFFISAVVVGGLLIEFSLPGGFLNDVRELFGFERTNLLGVPEYFRVLFTSAEVWQFTGFNSIIFLAAVTSVDPQLYEAATIDGAGRLKQTWHVTLPGILTTVVILLILRIGNLMSVGFERIILIYNPTIFVTADVISSFVYRRGIMEADFAFSTAVGLFNSIINFALLVVANQLSKKYTSKSLW
jgi:putative aldouronate transport system permease protein